MEQAIADYSQAIQPRPNYAYAFNNRGTAYMAGGRPDEALSDFDRALQPQPDFPQAYSNRGNVYNRMGRLDLALPDFFRAGGSLMPVFLAVGLLVAVIVLGASVANRVARRRLRKSPRNLQDF